MRQCDDSSRRDHLPIVAASSVTSTLYITPVSRHEDILTGIAAAGYAVEVENFDFAYALYSGDPSNGSSTRVASFREGRIGYRLWATKTGRIGPSVEDRYDHDVDELMA